MSKTKFKADYFGDKEKVSKIDYCTFCWDYVPDEKRKKVPIYACVGFGQSGFNSPETVCRNCLCAVISQEIESIRTCPSDQYDGKEWRIPIEIEVIKSIAFEGLD